MNENRAIDEDIYWRARLVSVAYDWRGTPYRHQASAKGQGADCLGLVRGIWRDLVGVEPIPLPPYRADWDERGSEETLLDAAKTYLRVSDTGMPLPGDVLLFRMRAGGLVKHCGIYVGEARFIHAYQGRAVTASWYSRFWQRRTAGIFAFPLPNDRGQG